MGKVNFTKEHMARLKALATEMLFKNDHIGTNLGQLLNVVDVLHCTTINSLTKIRLDLAKKIEQLENADEWVTTDREQLILSEMKDRKEFVNLVIGYKRYMDELATISAKKEKLQKEIDRLKDEQKTPADRLKEAEDALAALNSGDDF
jgi:chromosome segregation ATPase